MAISHCLTFCLVFLLIYFAFISVHFAPVKTSHLYFRFSLQPMICKCCVFPRVHLISLAQIIYIYKLQWSLYTGCLLLNIGFATLNWSVITRDRAGADIVEVVGVIGLLTTPPPQFGKKN